MNDVRSLLNKGKFKLDHAKQVLAEELEREKEIQKQHAVLTEAVQVVQVVAQAVQEAVHGKIADVVTSCLEAIFETDAYTFQITFERKRNRTEATLSFVRDGLEVDPMTAAGGGVVDVAAFALRIACLTLSTDLEQTLILDEPFRFLSYDYQPRVPALLESLADKLGIQFIVVTHSETLRIGKVVEIEGPLQGPRRPSGIRMLLPKKAGQALIDAGLATEAD